MDDPRWKKNVDYDGLVLFGSLDPRNLSRKPDPKTSHEAAEYMTESGELGAAQAFTLELVRANPSQTNSELALLAGLRDGRKTGRRLPELERLGLIVREPARRCSVTNRNAHTWRVK
jgi:hypothetical protein